MDIDNKYIYIIYILSKYIHIINIYIYSIYLCIYIYICTYIYIYTHTSETCIHINFGSWNHTCPKFLWFQSQVKWFTDGAEFNTNHEMLIWLWSSNLADASTSKHPFAALPLHWFPNKDLRKRANQVIVDCIAWDSILKWFCINYISHTFWMFQPQD